MGGLFYFASYQVLILDLQNLTNKLIKLYYETRYLPGENEDIYILKSFIYY